MSLSEQKRKEIKEIAKIIENLMLECGKSTILNELSKHIDLGNHTHENIIGKISGTDELINELHAHTHSKNAGHDHSKIKGHKVIVEKSDSTYCVTIDEENDKN